MIARIVQAVVIAVFVWMICIVIGTLLGFLGPIGETVGGLFIRFAVIAGALAGLWHAATGSLWRWPWPRQS